jgi:predicted RND superfamily exporter protein
MHNGDQAYYRIPDTREETAQYLLLFGMGGGTELDRLVTNDSTLARLSLFIPNMTTQQNRHLEKYLTEQINAAIKASPARAVQDTSYEITGIMVIWETINEYLTQSQIQSILLAMLVVCIVMVLVTRSLLLGITMTLCNTFVVVSVLGFMGFMHIPLDPYLILVGAIALGILDDDTIHFVRHFLHEMELHNCATTAIKNTFCTSGQAIFYTASIVTLSFLAYTFSELRSLTNFGLVSAVTVALGMVVEFFLTPSILLFIFRKKG